MQVSTRGVAVFKSRLFSIVVAFAVLAPYGASADDRFHHHRLIDRIVVFGDSLSDSGNAFALAGGQLFVEPPTYGMDGFVAIPGIPLPIPEALLMIPEAPYKQTERFTNGRHTWIEVLAGAVGLGPSAKPAYAGSHWKASNYAVGAATAADLGVTPFHLGEQVRQFLSDEHDAAPSDALYVIAIGGNDVRAAQSAEDPAAVFTAALTALANNVGKLYSKGARMFLIWNAPDIGRTPAVRRLDAVVCPALMQPLGCVATPATGASAAYNNQLQILLQGLRILLPEITIVQFDAFGKLGEVQDNPEKFGLRNTTQGCIQPSVPPDFPSSPPFRCKHPQDYFFWDGIHSTRAGHRIIALIVGQTLLTELVLDD